MLSAARVPVEVKVTNVEAGRSTSKAMVAAWEESGSQMVISRLPKRRHRLLRTLTSLFKILNASHVNVEGEPLKLSTSGCSSC